MSKAAHLAKYNSEAEALKQELAAIESASTQSEANKKYVLYLVHCIYFVYMLYAVYLAPVTFHRVLQNNRAHNERGRVIHSQDGVCPLESSTHARTLCFVYHFIEETNRVECTSSPVMDCLFCCFRLLS